MKQSDAGLKLAIILPFIIEKVSHIPESQAW